MKKAIIIGATSGLGREIALNLQRDGWTVGVAGRRVELLKEFAIYEQIDVTAEDAVEGVERLVEKLGGMDLFVNVAGVGFQNKELDSVVEKHTFDVNGYGFMRMVGWAYNYFKREKREGHIAIVSSIAGTKPLGTAAAYSATKRMQSHYLTALAQLARMEGVNIKFTDIRPGFAATDILNPNKHYPMMMSKERAGRLATKAILRKKRVAVIDWKFAVLTFFWSLIPRCVWERLTFVKN
ncbi:MAG: SDR family NAD(P)-dependent oxidoreductase [Paludibacteraceae bacterium]|nr:SDR family NAD(P)-dependent oxidoreductase [Paludibacteraceae bacterium]